MAPPPLTSEQIAEGDRPISIEGWFFAPDVVPAARGGKKSTTPAAPIALILHANGAVTWELVEEIPA